MGVRSVGQVPDCAVDVFVGPCVVRYFVDDIVSSQLGWRNCSEYRKDMCGGGFQAAGYNPHGIIQGYAQLFGMEVLAPYWSDILCAAVNNCKSCCLGGF